MVTASTISSRRAVEDPDHAAEPDTVRQVRNQARLRLYASTGTRDDGAVRSGAVLFGRDREMRVPY